ncbi:BACON domain-containing protein [Dysgonomonas sp. 25]|uniref:BACON domain-containing protein n=1 Tax=Dysgonomonas sp. 25 TaxID=2302933 RepID=UPI0013D206CD|nr:BACON domain-containing protein [Dysgonomonas sp. 25]NDV70137.1 hypothetical protein [Dysgonomonas sp. 25]
MKTIHARSILYALCIIIVGQVFFACSEHDNSKDPETRLSVDKLELTVIRTGRLSTGNKASLSILANRGYELSSDVDWITVDKPKGEGLTDVVLEVEENNTNAVRTGRLTVTSKDRTETILVTQTMDEDTDDGEAVGYVYLNEDFSWFEQYGGQDQVMHPDQGSTVPMRNQANAVQVFTERGYEEFNYSGNAFYMAKHYLKMGKNNTQNGLVIKLQTIAKGKSTNIKLTFDAAPVVSITGTGESVVLTGIDGTSISVEKLEGPGTINNSSAKVSDPISLGSVTSWGQWVTGEVTLYGVTSKTKIVIRSTQQGESGYKRWYLDNVKMVKAPRD